MFAAMVEQSLLLGVGASPPRLPPGHVAVAQRNAKECEFSLEGITPCLRQCLPPWTPPSAGTVFLDVGATKITSSSSLRPSSLKSTEAPAPDLDRPSVILRHYRHDSFLLLGLQGRQGALEDAGHRAIQLFDKRHGGRGVLGADQLIAVAQDLD